METTLINFRPCTDKRGKLVSAEGMINVPFPIKRAFWIYEVPFGEMRGGHANRTCHELLIAVSGDCMARVNGEVYVLQRPDQGLYIPPGVRIDLDYFSADCVLLVLASEYYDPEDKIQRFEARTLAAAFTGQRLPAGDGLRALYRRG